MMVENALAQTGLVFSGVSTLASCSVSASNPFQFMCCIYEGVLITMATASLGMALAGAFAGAAIVSFVALDVLGNTALFVGGITDSIPSMCGALGSTGSCRVPAA